MKDKLAISIPDFKELVGDKVWSRVQTHTLSDKENEKEGVTLGEVSVTSLLGDYKVVYVENFGFTRTPKGAVQFEEIGIPPPHNQFTVNFEVMNDTGLPIATTDINDMLSYEFVTVDYSKIQCE